jgi:hypothetical protein
MLFGDTDSGNPSAVNQTRTVTPDLSLTLGMDPYAPRAARYHIAQVDRPSPDLRDAIVLLTSELVTRAVQLCGSDTEEIELRAWMPADVVRVELHGPRELLGPPGGGERDYSVLLLDQLADRWALEPEGDLACMWFEIDRHPPSPAGGGERAGGGVHSLA